MRKFTVSLFFGASMLCAYAAEPELTFQGSGTESDPYLISTKADVLALADACGPGIVSNAGHYAGVYFKLTADIDMEQAPNFYGIGSAPKGVASANTYYFAGNFDGQGHRIKNMVIDGVSFDDSGKAITKWGANQSRAFVGFFGTVKSGGVVKNLIIDESCSVKGVKDCGGVVGYVHIGGTIENCANYADIVSYHQHAGGIAGEVLTTASGQPAAVRKCFNAGSIKVNHSYAGGITGGTNYGSIEECANIGSVSVTWFNSAATTTVQARAGGIAGSGTGATFIDCFNAGNVVAEKEIAGGIVGYGVVGGSMGAVLTCINTGAVWAYNVARIGNIVGYSGTTASMALKNVASCYYDQQMLNQSFLANGAGTCPEGSVKGMNTADLTSGTTLTGFSSRWKFTKGFYPVPAALDFDALKEAAGTYVVFPEGYSASHFVGTATLSTATEGISAALTDVSESVFSIVDGTVVSAPVANDVALGNLVLTVGNFNRTLPLTAYEIPFVGKGTKADPYTISTKSDMMALANISNKARVYWPGQYFKMTADIDMEGDKNFKGIAAGSDVLINTGALHTWHFDGVFDGDNHKISNLDINTLVFDEYGVANSFTGGSYHNTGLFASLGEGAEIKNLILDKSCKITGFGLIGGIAGALHKGPAYIDNCHVAATVTAYNRYCGGVFGYNAEHPVKITNSSFSGVLHCNWDYAGGIAGWNGHADALISNCVNTGYILVDRFNACVADNQKINRVGGLTAINSGTVEYSANYGPIKVDAPDAAANIDGVGGICGQNTNSAGMASLHHTLNVGQVSVNGAVETLNVGNILGWRYFNEKNGQGIIAANYCDTTLNMQNVPADSVPLTDNREAYIAMTTSKLTSGTPIEDLADYYSFEAGYYPIPKVFANVASVRNAAATFLTLPEGQSIRRIEAGAWAPFNDKIELTGTLDTEEGFEIRMNGLQALGSERTIFNTLTLASGDYFNFYPLRKLAGSWQDSVDTIFDEDVVNVEYFTPQGIRVAAPIKNQVTIAVMTSASGQKTVKKIITK